MPSKSKYPFSKMELGDSFFQQGDDNKAYWRLCNAVAYFGKKNNSNFRFTVKNVDGGARVWRIQ